MTGARMAIPGWRGGFGPHEIRAMFFRVQQVSALESAVRARGKRIAELEGDLAAETDRAERYRGLVKQESRWGLIWARVTS